MLVNSRPRPIVAHRPLISPSRSPWMRAWCAQVTVVPEQSRIRVLSRGRPNGSITAMPLGGQTPPTESTAGGKRAALKKAQNQARKNITSEAMNRIMP